ncbi:MAG: TraB/GumN family protein [Candidatus Devosia phytovorans]|uniref:TraB/GumN family protein n=1 Tax=Candidatus Devosia phytovorans TaxID=3121372 RepID=A0AAJ5VY96_9HYPH|nr:TraB/GumN family protein [Devosia sp.]WEK06385.1 MAG: TraB/GumN family protein [Devosia sp.]
MKLSPRCLIPALAALGLASPALAAPGLWEVRDQDSVLWIFGSFHILPEGLEWRTELFDTILADADKVVFEADVGPQAMAAVGGAAFARGIYVDGTLLTDVIGDDLEVQLRDYAGEVGLQLGPILAMKPWMATNTLSVAALAAEGYNEQGVELLLQPEIERDRLVFLETGKQQLDVLAGAPEEEQVAMLQSTLDEMHTLPKVMTKMLDHWSAGTADLLADMFLMEMGGFETAFMDRLIYDRNRNWIPPLEAMLEENQNNLVIVGAAHLVGDDSVLDLLEKAGYTVERVQ